MNTTCISWVRCHASSTFASFFCASASGLEAMTEYQVYRLGQFIRAEALWLMGQFDEEFQAWNENRPSPEPERYQATHVAHSLSAVCEPRPLERVGRCS